MSPPRPARILLHSAAPKADGGGVQRMVVDLARHLRAGGHEVATAWPDGAGTPEDWRLALEAGVGPSGRPGPRELVRAGRGAAGLAGRLARFRPGVVNLHYPMGQTAYFAALARLLRYRLVLSFHNSDLREASPALRAALPRLLRAADAVTAVSDDLAEELRALAPEAGVGVQVVPNGVDTSFWSPGGAPREAGLVVAAGRLLPMKGFDLLLPAFARGAPGEARLVVAGEGPDRTRLEAQAASLGLTGRASFPGRMDAEALRGLYRRASLFVLPSRREGMPLALIEAMAAGLPAVAAAVNGVPDVLTPEAGTLVPPEDEGALADALSARLSAPGRLAGAGEAARGRAMLFREAETYARYEAILTGEGEGARG